MNTSNLPHETRHMTRCQNNRTATEHNSDIIKQHSCWAETPRPRYLPRKKHLRLLVYFSRYFWVYTHEPLTLRVGYLWHKLVTMIVEDLRPTGSTDWRRFLCRNGSFTLFVLCNEQILNRALEICHFQERERERHTYTSQVYAKLAKLAALSVARPRDVGHMRLHKQ